MRPAARMMLGSGSALFSPASLFAGGEQGFWYDPSDLSTVWQDSARTTPGAVDQPVGCIDDKSGRGNNATQSTSGSRPILRQSGGLYYLEFDGTDDGLATGTITPGVDEMQIFAGVYKASDAARGMIAEHSNTAANQGCFLLEGPSFAGGNDFRYACGGTLAFTGIARATSIAAPTTKVLTGIGDISGRTAKIRVNQAETASLLNDQGTGNFTAQVVNIGRRGSGTFYLNGRIYGMLCRFGSNLSAEQIAAAERWLAIRTGVVF